MDRCTFCQSALMTATGLEIAPYSVFGNPSRQREPLRQEHVQRGCKKLWWRVTVASGMAVCGDHDRGSGHRRQTCP